MSALFELPERPVEPSSCTGTPHRHRWIRFGRDGDRDEVLVEIQADGTVTFSEQAIALVLKQAGFVIADPNAVESAAARRLEWARSRLMDTLNRRAR